VEQDSENIAKKSSLNFDKNEYSKKSLIIDDDKWTRTLLLRFLKELRIQVIEADNPYTGISLAVREKPEMIFLDIFLPEINGDKILKIFKELDDTKSIPVIVISGNFSKELLHDTYTRGAAGFISKPFNREVVYEMLKKVLKSDLEKTEETTEWVKEL
jgi:two-component system chemotaxis response regulator CheY